MLTGKPMQRLSKTTEDWRTTGSVQDYGIHQGYRCGAQKLKQLQLVLSISRLFCPHPDQLPCAGAGLFR
jgi:hypothetical protein